jgi:twitching motility protein PilU
VAEIKEIMKKSANLGMQTFDQALFDLPTRQVISYEDALRNADSVNDLRLQIKLNSQRAKSPDLAAGTEHFCRSSAPHARHQPLQPALFTSHS